MMWGLESSRVLSRSHDRNQFRVRIDGLYDAPPASNPNAKLVPVVESVTSEIEAMAGAAESELSRGGMRTKIEAAKIATTSSTPILIASGQIEHPLQAISDGRRCPLVLTPPIPA